jgi:E3 ubiquitin-protein ligase SHPRH
VIDNINKQTTLIVTPLSLASQWVDELKFHAPSLKVLIYDGWSKLEVPVTEADAKAERERRRNNKIKGKANTASTSKTKPATMSNPRRTRTANGKGNLPDSDAAMDVEDQGDSGSGREDVIDWCSYVNTFDVCITTYNVLRLDFNVARAPPIRPRREDVVYSNAEKPRSPLVMCEWYRVIMDEVGSVKNLYEHNH